MKEWYMIATMGLGGVCFAAGGTGPKWVRRFLLPCIWAGIALLSHCNLWGSLALLLYIPCFCLPYGSKTPYWGKTLAFISYSLPSLGLGFTFWQIITPLLCLLIFRLSNWKPTSGMFTWKVCEFLIGTLIAITVAVLI